MKIIKTILVLVLVVIAVAMITMLIMPVKQRVQRSIQVNAPAAEVYSYLSKLENFNKWSAWSRSDSSLQYTLSGTDGTLGAENRWVGDPELSGEGSMKITSLEINQEIEHEIQFIKPRQMKAHSEFDLKETNGRTLVTWRFDLDTPRPWNIFNLFSRMDREMGKDFEEGLRNLRTAIEKNKVAAKEKTYEVKQMNFPATRFALYRERVNWENIQAFYAAHLPRLYAALGRAGASPATPYGLYFTWDELNKQTEMAAALPVGPEIKPEGDSIQVTDMAGSKAIYVDYYGAYDKIAPAYASMDKYMAENKLKQKSPVIEQYMTDPKAEKDTSRWLTRVIFLVE